MLKYKYIFQVKKLLWFEITKMLIAVKNKFIVLFIMIFAHFRFL